jgi:outer membrane protein assembly factor BamB
MPRLLTGLVLLAATFANFIPAPAADPGTTAARPFDWPQWRGPRRDAVCTETGLLPQWPKDGPPLVWKQKGLGGGYSTPSVAAGRIYGLSYQGGDEVVWARDEATGGPVWTTRINAKGDAFVQEGPHSTPTVDGNRLYAVGIMGSLVCLDTATGRVVWRKSFTDDFDGKMMSGWGYAESPLVDGNKVICTPGGDNAALAALDKATGQVLWTAKVPDNGGAGYASPMPAEVGGVRMYMNWLGTRLVGVAAADGNSLWEYKRAANSTANIPTVIVRGDTVFCSTSYGKGSAILKLVPARGGVRAQEVKYLGSEAANHHGGMVLVGDHVYMGHGHNDGQPMCVDFKTGAVSWRQRQGAGTGSAAVLYADGNLIFRWEDGTVGLIEANPRAYKLKSRFQQPDRSGNPAWAHPVIANGRMYLRDQDVLLCYDVKKRS